jgi:hypothetical protein
VLGATEASALALAMDDADATGAVVLAAEGAGLRGAPPHATSETTIAASFARGITTSRLRYDALSAEMNVREQIKKYLASVPEPARSDMSALHRLISRRAPAPKLWFLDGKNEEKKTVSNPNIGYGSQVMKYKDGRTREFYRVGLSANKSGISIYVLGLDDKTFLAKTYGKKIGKATVTGYCIKLKTLADVDVDVLEDAIRFGLER